MLPISLDLWKYESDGLRNQTKHFNKNFKCHPNSWTFSWWVVILPGRVVRTSPPVSQTQTERDPVTYLRSGEHSLTPNHLASLSLSMVLCVNFLVAMLIAASIGTVGNVWSSLESVWLFIWTVDFVIRYLPDLGVGSSCSWWVLYGNRTDLPSQAETSGLERHWDWRGKKRY